MTDETPTRLFALQRRERLMDELRLHGAVTVRDVAVTLGVSELTIRRDINSLAEQGLATRVHGGATLRSSLEPSLATGFGGRESTVAKYTIGMMVPSLDYYWPQVVSGARAHAAQLHTRLILRGSTYDVRDNRKQVQALARTPGLHGLIVAPLTAGETGVEMLRWLGSLPLPVVMAERRVRSSAAVQNLETVATDHSTGAAQAVRHLHAAGHERIGLLTEPGNPTTPHVRRGWRKAINALGLPGDVVNANAVSFGSTDREEVMDHILSQCTETRTSALVILSDPQAIAFEQHCIDRGLRVPDDMAIVAYDDEVARLGDPPITAVRPPKQYVGREAVDLLIARLESGRSRPAHHVMLNPELIVRESSDARPSSSRREMRGA